MKAKTGNQKSTFMYGVFGAILTIGVLAASPVTAGWIIEEVDADFPDETTTYYFQKGKARVEGILEELEFVIDFKEQKGFLVDREAGKVAGGTIKEIVGEFADYEDEEFGDFEEPAAVAPDVKIKKMPVGETVAGFETVRYQVMEDDELVEELWVAEGLTVHEELSLDELNRTLEKMLGGEAPDDEDFPLGYEDHPDYLKLLGKGYPVRQVFYFLGEKSTIDVKRAEKKDIPSSDFEIPANLEKTPYLELLMGE